ncbi:MAG: peptide chain release factor N(5)-glutamine methyltransferase [Chloroflexi bacterium]|nr:peptide chain release factor N(5)-glutamine methyltransferase [Chloroflexota bacterium]
MTRLQSAGIEEARLDAELLLASACELPRANLLAHGSDPASPALARRFRQLLERRASHEPVAYILGHKEFYGLDLMVDGRVLIPRPETELLVERALGWIRDRSPSPQRFVQSDLLAQADGPADLMVANLPYVAHHEWPALAPDIASYEPRLALDGGPDGLECIHRFFVQSPAFLAPGGAIVLEIGWRQAEAVRQMAQAAFPASSLDVHQDGAGLDRVVVVSPSAKAPITAVG